MIAINIIFTILCIILVIGMRILHKECLSHEDTITKVVFYVLTIPAVGYIIFLVIENWVALYHLSKLLN